MVGSAPCFAHQRDMAAMKRAHGRHQRDRAAPFAPGAAKHGHRSPKRIDLTDYLHGSPASDTG